VQRSFTRFIGVDLGGGRGKTTAIAELRTARNGGAEVYEVATRAPGQPWTDDSIVQRLSSALTEPGSVAVAIDAPLTQPACGRCVMPACPGMEVCVDPAVEWLRTEGRALVRVGAKEVAAGSRSRSLGSTSAAQARLAPYTHRATDVDMTYRRGLLPLAALGAASGTVAARAHQLRRRLKALGFELHENLIEVSPQATIGALFDTRTARGYKRDADPWRTRAVVLERLGDLTFAPQSRMAREDVLQNDHCFDAVISAYTAYLWARDGWAKPAAPFDTDGFIYAPPLK
jgi:predicted nuclease with RNAse H fold